MHISSVHKGTQRYNSYLLLSMKWFKPSSHRYLSIHMCTTKGETMPIQTHWSHNPTDKPALIIHNGNGRPTTQQIMKREGLKIAPYTRKVCFDMPEKSLFGFTYEFQYHEGSLHHYFLYK